MHALRFDRILRHRFTCLLWLALLLPLAQTVAAMHLLSHWQRQASAQVEDPKFLHDDACAVCLGATAVVGGAPLAAAGPAVHAMVPDRMAAPEAPPPRFVLLTRAYLSRAPPIASC